MYSQSNQPDYPAALGLLQHMNSDQLKEILNDDEKFDDFIKDMPQMKALYEEKEMLMASNKSLAEYNLSQEPVISEGKQQLVEKYQKAALLAEEVKKVKSELDAQTGKVSPDTMLALLQASNQEAEEESELIADEFLNNGGSIEDFVDNFREKRKVAHLRRVKIDKMRELLAGKKASGPSRQAPPPPTLSPQSSPYHNPGSNYNQPSHALPYPSQQSYNMPTGPSNYYR